MNRGIRLLLLLLITSVLTIGCQPAGKAGPTPSTLGQQQPALDPEPDLLPTPAPGRLIRLAWFYKPPSDGLLDPLANISISLFLPTKTSPLAIGSRHTG